MAGQPRKREFIGDLTDRSLVRVSADGMWLPVQKGLRHGPGLAAALEATSTFHRCERGLQTALLPSLPASGGSSRIQSSHSSTTCHAAGTNSARLNLLCQLFR